MINNDTLISGGVTTDICIYHLSKGGNFYMKYNEKINTNVKRHISPFEHKCFYYISDINESLLSDLTCPICLNIVWNPVECNECGNIFCEYCAKKISNSYRSYCPICKKIFVTS